MQDLEARLEKETQEVKDLLNAQIEELKRQVAVLSAQNVSQQQELVALRIDSVSLRLELDRYKVRVLELESERK